jgi:hypothetical protein
MGQETDEPRGGKLSDFGKKPSLATTEFQFAPSGKVCGLWRVSHAERSCLPMNASQRTACAPLRRHADARW